MGLNKPKIIRELDLQRRIDMNTLALQSQIDNTYLDFFLKILKVMPLDVSEPVSTSQACTSKNFRGFLYFNSFIHEMLSKRHIEIK